MINWIFLCLSMRLLKPNPSKRLEKQDTGNMELLFASLLNASNPAEYQKITLTIQHKLRENGLDKNNATNCFHPMWFGVNEKRLTSRRYNFAGFAGTNSVARNLSNQRMIL